MRRSLFSGLSIVKTVRACPPARVYRVAQFCDNSKVKSEDVPDEFFDDSVEAEKEFCDVSMSLIHKRGLEGINTIYENYSWNDLSKYSNYKLLDDADENKTEESPEFKLFLEKVREYKRTAAESSVDKKAEMERLKSEVMSHMVTLKESRESVHDDHHNKDQEPGEEAVYEGEGTGRRLVQEARRGPFIPDVSDVERMDTSLQSAVQDTIGWDLPQDLSHLEEKNFFTPHMLNTTIPQRTTDEYPFPQFEDFMKNTDPSKFPEDQQGSRHCPGRLQRRGTRTELGCHLIDLATVHPMDIHQLKRFLSLDGEIMGRKHTGLCSRCQRKVARTIKHSRSIGILPHQGYIHLTDARPSKLNKPFHDVIKKGGKKGKAVMSTMVPLN